MFQDAGAAAKLQAVSTMPRHLPALANRICRPGLAAGLAMRPCLRWMLGLTAVSAAACGGHLSHRSLAELATELPISQEVRRIRIELEDGTIGLDSATAATVSCQGGVRRAADSAADLARLERIPLVFLAAPDPADATTLVVQAPRRGPDDPPGVFSFELGVRLPAELPVEVRIRGNGHVTVANRRAETVVDTGRGDLRFEACAGAVRARTGRGMVIAFEHRGDLDVHCKVGDMQAFVREPGERIRLVTGQGTVQCHVPTALEFDLDARAETGRIGNGFGLTTERVGEFGAVLTGVRGAGRTKIVLRTGSGHLSLSPHRFGDD